MDRQPERRGFGATHRTDRRRKIQQPLGQPTGTVFLYSVTPTRIVQSREVSGTK
jgi:hypothetical protein